MRAHQDIAFRVACLAGGSAADAEESAQEGFVKAWRALPRFRTGAPFRPWLLAIVANEARNRRRAAGRRAGLALRAAEQAEHAPGAGGASPETLVLAGAQRRALLAALGALDERDRSVLTCRYLLELSEEETAAALGCRRGTVKSRTSRALERLRAHASVEEGGGAVTELELQLLALREDVAWPATPDLATAVQARVARAPRPQRRGGRRPAWLAPVLVATVALLLALGAVLAASPGVRATVRDWLGIGSVRIARVQRLPDLSSAPKLELGRRASAAAADRHLGSPIATVRALGAPDAIYLGDALPARVSLVYAARPGLPPGTAGVGALLDQLQGDAMIFVEKLVAGNVPVTRVRVNGAPGYFIGGAHSVSLPDELRPRLAGNTLVWVRDAVTYRLETKLGRAAALRLARSVG